MDIPTARLIGDIGIDACCEGMLKAWDDYSRGEIDRETYDRLRSHWGGMFLASQGVMQPYRHPGQGDAG